MSVDIFSFVVLLASSLLQALLVNTGWYAPLVLMTAYWLFMRRGPMRHIVLAACAAAFLDALWHYEFPVETAAVIVMALVSNRWREFGSLHSLPALMLGGCFCAAVVLLFYGGYELATEHLNGLFGRHLLKNILKEVAQDAVLMPLIGVIYNWMYPAVRIWRWRQRHHL